MADTGDLTASDSLDHVEQTLKNAHEWLDLVAKASPDERLATALDALATAEKCVAEVSSDAGREEVTLAEEGTW